MNNRARLVERDISITVNADCEDQLSAGFRAADGDMVILFSIHDTGIGISPEMRDYLFELFIQGDGTVSRRFGGTGLGLAIVRKIVDEHEGGIWVANAPAGGAVVILRFPVSGQNDACRPMPAPTFTKEQ